MTINTTQQINLTEFTDGLLETSKGILATGQDLMPIFATISLKSGVTIMGLSFDGTEQKRAVYAAISKLVAKADVDCCVTINDSWCKSTPADASKAELNRLDNEGIANDPDKTEAIIMFISPKDGEDSMVVQRYHREAGAIVWDGKATEPGAVLTNRLIPPTWKNRKPDQKVN